MRSLPTLSLILVVLAACGGGSGTPPDATDSDADVPDAMVIIEPDAAIPPDGPEYSTNPDVVCGALCAVIGACFGDGGPDPSCLADCATDLSDCSPEQVSTLHACGDLGCDPLIDCVLAVECIEDGGKEPYCGDGTCDPDEDCGTCANDCGACVCGDAVCSLGECATCEGDCPGGCVCPHDTCTTGVALDPGCDTCAVDICAVDPYCCETEWDQICVDEAGAICGKECPGAPTPDAGVPDVDASVPDVDAGVPADAAPGAAPRRTRAGRASWGTMSPDARRR